MKRRPKAPGRDGRVLGDQSGLQLSAQAKKRCMECPQLLVLSFLATLEPDIKSYISQSILLKKTLQMKNQFLGRYNQLSAVCCSREAVSWGAVYLRMYQGHCPGVRVVRHRL